MRTATRNGVTYRYVEVWDDDSFEQRLYLYSMPVGLNYPHYCVDNETVKEFKAGGEYSVVAWKYMREIEEPKAEAEQEAIPVGTPVWAWWHDVKRLALYAADTLVRFLPDGPTVKCDRVERVDLKSLGLPQTSSKAEQEALNYVISKGTIVWAWDANCKTKVLREYCEYSNGRHQCYTPRSDGVDYSLLMGWDHVEVVRQTPSRQDLIWTYCAGWNDAERSVGQNADVFVSMHFPGAV